MPEPVNYFFMGKGGVGKSTSSALYSVFMAEKGYRVLMVSLDPAHNQSDIFDTQLSDKPKAITSNFTAVEVDQDRWIKIYLKDVQQQINRTYAYLTAFNLDRYFNVIKHSPGLEEYALTLAFRHLCAKFAHYDYLVFDMPPTALSLKFFYLPSLSLLWVEQLLALRQELIRKRDIITKIKLGRKEFERDKVLRKIGQMRDEFQSLKELFEDSRRTRVDLVLNPDRLSFAESLRIFHGLGEIDVHLDRLVYNKMRPDTECALIDPAMQGLPMLNFPHSETPLIGYDTLRRFLRQNDELVGKQLAGCLLNDSPPGA
jgi:arsenite-transporting ATPase